MNHSLETAISKYNGLKNSCKEIKILLVTKGVEMQFLNDFILRTNHLYYGENYAKELKKWLEIKQKHPEIRISFLGSFQSGNIRNIVKVCDVVEGISSLKDLEKIRKEALKHGKRLECYAQINIGNESQKNGFKIEEVVPEMAGKFDGIMCIPPQFKSPAPFFKKMRELAKILEVSNISMGMSSDYREAIESGSTEIRIGNMIFGKAAIKN